MKNMHRIITLLFLAAIATTANAQWTDDPAVNTMFNNEGTSVLCPEVITNPVTGYSYLHWFILESGECHPKLQYVDPDGYVQWQENGIYISTNPNSSALYGTGFDITSDGNAVVFFPDERLGSFTGFVYCISPEGEFLWGADGINATSGYEVMRTYVIADKSGGSVWLAWIDGTYVYFRHVEADGTMSDVVTLGNGTNTLGFPAFTIDENNNLFVSYFKMVGGYFMWPENEVWLVKYGTDMQPLSEPTMLVQAYTMNFVRILSACEDGNGGGYIAYTPTPDMHEIIIAHYDNDGNATTNTQGVYVAPPNGNTYHYYPVFTYDPATSNMIVFYRASDAGYESYHTLYAQSIDMGGTAQWGDMGVEIMPLGTTYVLPVGIAPVESGGAILFYAEGYPNSIYKSLRLDYDGTVLWGGEHVFLSSANSEKDFSEMPLNVVNNQIVTMWYDDGRTTGTGVYGQNINLNGTLGINTATCEPPALSISTDFCDVELWWTEVEGATGYFYNVNGELFDNGTSTEVSLYKEPDGTSSYYKVFAVCPSGNSEYSENENYFLGLCEAPTPTSLSVEPEGLKLMWTAGNAPVNSAYNIYKDGSFLVSLDLDVFEYVDTDVSFGNTYCYQLSSDCSSNCSETSLSEEICRLYDYNGIYNLENKLSIAPNPANDYVKINVNGAIKSISIVSTLGQRMLDTNVADNEIRLDVSDFPDGMYIALFETDGLLISRKFIVRH